MSPESVTSRKDIEGLAAGLGSLKPLINDLGLSLSLWDLQAETAIELVPGGEFCHMLCGAQCDCEGSRRNLALRVISEGIAATEQAPSGCQLLAVPVQRRRRMIGVAVLGVPVREMLEEEHLARLCDRLQLDRQAVEQLADREIRYSIANTSDLLHMVGWAIKRELDREIAGDELAMLSANLSTTYEELSLLYRVSGAMRVTQRPQDFLRTICNELLDVMNIEAVAGVLYAYPPTVESDVAVVAGELQLEPQQIASITRDNLAPAFATSGHGIINNEFIANGDEQSDAKISQLIAVPLMSDTETIGMLLGLNKLHGEFDSVDMKLLNAIASQAGVFLANSRLYAELESLLMGVLHALTATIDAKDPYTCGHSRRVALISKRLAEEMGFSPRRVQNVYLAGLLHDIGKIGVPEGILCKDGRLDDDEYEKIKLHPGLGAKILGGIRQLDDVIVGILTHHERPDGRGYPRGLEGGEVPMEGRIIGLADSFDAMTSSRTYRKALPLEVVIDEIRKCAGTQFDLVLAEKFLEMDLEEFLEEISRPAATVFPLENDSEGVK